MANRPIFPRVISASGLDPWDYGPQNLTRPVATPPRGNLIASTGGGVVPVPTGPIGPGRWNVLPHQYAYPTTNLSRIIGTTSEKVLDQPNNYRNLLIIRNPNAVAILYAQFGGEASALESAIVIAPGIMVLLDSVVPQDDLWIVSDTASSRVNIAYANLDLPTKDY